MINIGAKNIETERLLLRKFQILDDELMFNNWTSDDDTNMVNIGYCTGKKWWENGFTSEAFKAVIKYFFTKTDIICVEAVHDANNSNSGKVMQKCNMKYEGMLRKAGINNQGICDICCYSIISEDML